MRKVIMVAIAIMIAGIVAGSIFYACKKEEKTIEQNNVKIHKFDPNLHGIDIAAICEDASVIHLGEIIADYDNGLCDFTEDELAQLEELTKLMQKALDEGHLDLAMEYAENFMNIYDKCGGKEKLETFQMESGKCLSEICNAYPAFSSLDDNQKVEVLNTCYQYKRDHDQQNAPFGCHALCTMAWSNARESAGNSLAIGLVGCAATCWTLGPAALCVAIVAGKYVYDLKQADNQLKTCTGYC
jgi:hypothetical protein